MQVLSQAFIYGDLETFKDNIWESYSLYLEIIIHFKKQELSMKLKISFQLHTFKKWKHFYLFRTF